MKYFVFLFSLVSMCSNTKFKKVTPKCESKIEIGTEIYTNDKNQAKTLCREYEKHISNNWECRVDEINKLTYNIKYSHVGYFTTENYNATIKSLNQFMQQNKNHKNGYHIIITLEVSDRNCS